MSDVSPGPELIEYRAVSRLAVVALLLGLASPLALISPLLWPLAFVGAIVGVAAVVHVERNSQTLVGRTAALVGLALCVYFAAAAPARMVTRRYWLNTRAQAFAQDYFDLLRDRKGQQAHQLTLPAESRQAVAEEEEKKEGADSASDDLESENTLASFLKRPVVAALLELGPQAELAYLGSESPGDDVVVLNYELRHPPAAQDMPSGVRLVLQRTLDTQGREQWRIISSGEP